MHDQTAGCRIKKDIFYFFHEVFLLKGRQSKLSSFILTFSSATSFMSRGQNHSSHRMQFIHCKLHFAVGNVTLCCLQCCPRVGFLKGLETDSVEVKTFEKQGSNLDVPLDLGWLLNPYR